MAELIAIAYPGSARAAEALDALKQLERDKAIELEDSAAVSKDEDGRFKVEGAGGHAAKGAGAGLVLGALVGMIFLAPVVGAAFGAAAGALSGRLYDVQQIDDFMLDVRQYMPPGSSVLLLLVGKANPEETLAVLGDYGGKVIRTSLPDDAEARLAAALGSGVSGRE